MTSDTTLIGAHTQSVTIAFQLQAIPVCCRHEQRYRVAGRQMVVCGRDADGNRVSDWQVLPATANESSCVSMILTDMNAF